METQNRFKSPVFWTAIAAQLLSILVCLGVVDFETKEALEGVVIAVCELLTVFGIFNNPTNKSGV